MNRLPRCVTALSLIGVLAVGVSPLWAQVEAQSTARRIQAKGIRFLRLTQGRDGSWTSPNVPGIAALSVTALLENGVPADDEAVAKGLAFLLALQQKDGGIYHPKTLHRNYETSIALMAFVAANQDGKYDAAIAGAKKFLKGLQWDEDEEQKPEDPGFGGAGYGKHQRPDLSNTSFLIEALKKAGVKADDPAMKKALMFVSRCQNLETEHNNTPFAAKVDDGGFYYTPAAGGTSQAGVLANGGLRSYASMTYAGLKSMIYAGLKKDDPRVAAGVAWLRKHYSLKDNPGLGERGLYYYYTTFAKTLSALGEDDFEDADGAKHNWRADLVETLAAKQRPNGSWINREDRWYEGDPNLVTAYALLALSHCVE